MAKKKNARGLSVPALGVQRAHKQRDKQQRAKTASEKPFSIPPAAPARKGKGGGGGARQKSSSSGSSSKDDGKSRRAFARWLDDYSTVAAALERHGDLEELLDANGGLVRIDSFLPQAAAEGVLRVLRELPGRSASVFALVCSLSPVVFFLCFAACT